jgi:hypothetical protein
MDAARKRIQFNSQTSFNRSGFIYQCLGLHDGLSNRCDQPAPTFHVLKNKLHRDLDNPIITGQKPIVPADVAGDLPEIRGV